MMNYEYRSVLKDMIRDLISEKRALGFKYKTIEWKLKELDQLAVKNGITQIELTKDFVEEYISKKPNEKPVNTTNRAGAVRTLAKYMVRRGYPAYVLPPAPHGSYNRSFVPHIYTDEEIRKIFTAIDEYAQAESLDGQHYPQRIKYTVIFRILYSTGMRLGEVLGLTVNDVDLDNRQFIIRNAKNNRERIIPVHENVIKRLRQYMIDMELYRTNQYIFSNCRGEPISCSTVDSFFLKFLHLAGIPHPKDGPRIHDFRHTFCVHRLRDWVLEGRDINALFPYLCAYMGHADTRSTEYYLRLTSDLYPDMILKTEQYFNGAGSDE